MITKYTKVGWTDSPSTTTPINATNLNHMDEAIYDLYENKPTTPEIKNEKTTSATDAYSCDFINNLHTYSTTERIIGTWINGKPVYVKVFEGTTDATATLTQLITNIDAVISCEGYLQIPGGIGVNVPTTDNVNYARTYLDMGTHILYLNYSNAYVSRQYKVAVKYTKTTD